MGRRPPYTRQRPRPSRPPTPAAPSWTPEYAPTPSNQSLAMISKYGTYGGIVHTYGRENIRRYRRVQAR